MNLPMGERLLLTVYDTCEWILASPTRRPLLVPRCQVVEEAGLQLEVEYYFPSHLAVEVDWFELPPHPAPHS